jgi:ribosomal-protein-alanine N-acetyltransferase
MTPETMAATHARAFAGHGRAWSATEFCDLMHSDHVFHRGDARAFALGRVVADEVELLTLATDPAHRRCGLARDCLQAFEAHAAARGAASAFLEVAEDYAPARVLYHAAGYVETGRRKGYYTTQRGKAVDAILLSKTLI